MEGLITRLRRSGFVLLIGCLLIIYIALGFIYFQQGPLQRKLDEQIAKLTVVVSKPLPNIKELQTGYDNVTRSLSANISESLDELVDIAEKSGIDVDPDSDKLYIPPVLVTKEKVGGGNYQVLSFRNIRVQGNYDNVTAFISALDSSESKTMVLKRVGISLVEDETTANLDVYIYTKPGK